jgi:hypothetical protein
MACKGRILVFAAVFISAGCMRTFTNTDEKFRSKNFAAQPSAVTLAPDVNARGMSYESFVSAWMTKLGPTAPDTGAFAAYRLTVSPPPTLEYEDVGSRELDESLYFFRNWCRQNGGAPAEQAADDLDHGEWLSRMIDVTNRGLEGRPTFYCKANGSPIAAIVLFYSPKNQAIQPVSFEVHHYSLASISAARDRDYEQRKLAREQQKEAAQSVDAERRALERATLQRLNQESQPLRRSVKIGSETHCGLVIDVRQPLAQVQSPDGPYWLKIEQLFLPGVGVRCTFVNGRYVEP